MAIKKITREEFDAVPGATRGRKLSAEMAAIRSLAVGEAVKFPCRWKHTPKTRNCTTMPHGHPGIKTKARCIDGIVYVLRIA